MKTSTATPRADLYTRVTERVIADLEAGVRPWTKPWDAANTYDIGLPVRHNGIPYRGVNVLILWGEALGKGYSSPVWMTFKQALALGVSVRKGEHGSMVVYADRFTRVETDVNGNDVEREIPFLKAYTVFNVAQIDGLSAQYYANPERRPDKFQLIEAAERFFRRDGGRRPSRRRRGVLRSRARRHSATLARDLPRSGKLRRDEGARAYALDITSSAACARFWREAVW